MLKVRILIAVRVGSVTRRLYCKATSPPYAKHGNTSVFTVCPFRCDATTRHFDAISIHKNALSEYLDKETSLEYRLSMSSEPPQVTVLNTTDEWLSESDHYHHIRVHLELLAVPIRLARVSISIYQLNSGDPVDVVIKRLSENIMRDDVFQSLEFTIKKRIPYLSTSLSRSLLG